MAMQNRTREELLAELYRRDDSPQALGAYLRWLQAHSQFTPQEMDQVIGGPPLDIPVEDPTEELAAAELVLPPTGSRWSEEEEVFIVIAIMYSKQNKWISDNMPGPNHRSPAAVSARLQDMRQQGRVSARWRWPNGYTETKAWTIEEDMEIIQWYVWGRKKIDSQVFVANNRAGLAVVKRADFLAQDPHLLSWVRENEEDLRQVLEELDTGEPSEEDDPALNVTGRSVVALEDEYERQLRLQLRFSMATYKRWNGYPCIRTRYIE
ncbi:hypothetical protein AJ80_03187 [Polytolypa hystricis UAMH7299]|uniref:Uncharacterized protein n=1 Tax=Polytolypa hystricis (strain UAMH7299) TaxID=1447883 RepID=A0A2B7YKD1_POLH7|nr:hypothetical protein AJ80_03187 [Polytolypa hystricis UAMH7299]